MAKKCCENKKTIGIVAAIVVLLAVSFVLSGNQAVTLAVAEETFSNVRAYSTLDVNIDSYVHQLAVHKIDPGRSTATLVFTSDPESGLDYVSEIFTLNAKPTTYYSQITKDVSLVKIGNVKRIDISGKELLYIELLSVDNLEAEISVRRVQKLEK